MNRACMIRDEQLVAFAGGEEFDLDAHVATCEECQDFLSELWAGELDHDISEPVVEAIRLELFLIDIAKLMGDVAELYGKAGKVYLLGADEPAEEDRDE